MQISDEQRIKSLPCWRGATIVMPMEGGITNFNYRVVDSDGAYVVRLGNDNPVHLISRSNELASSQAAFDIGVSPELLYSEPGVMVIRYIEGRVLVENDVRDRVNLYRIIDLVKKFHQRMPLRMSGYALMFWVFQVLRHYRQVLDQGNSDHLAELPELMDIALTLEKQVGRIDIAYCHNDLLAANFIDDGERLWLIDFDYAGFNSPLFDLANLSSNNGLSAAEDESLLQYYYGHRFSKREQIAFSAMKCASLLRETMWSMVSEIHSELAFDFANYTAVNLQSFHKAWKIHQAM